MKKEIRIQVPEALQAELVEESKTKGFATLVAYIRWLLVNRGSK